jgi:hypothetical protein
MRPEGEILAKTGGATVLLAGIAGGEYPSCSLETHKRDACVTLAQSCYFGWREFRLGIPAKIQ